MKKNLCLYFKPPMKPPRPSFSRGARGRAGGAAAAAQRAAIMRAILRWWPSFSTPTALRSIGCSRGSAARSSRPPSPCAGAGSGQDHQGTRGAIRVAVSFRCPYTISAGQPLRRRRTRTDAFPPARIRRD